MKNYERLSEIKPSDNEYVFLKNTSHSKPNELLYTNNQFIDFDMKKYDVKEDAFWRPVNAINPISRQLCKLILELNELPSGSEIDGYQSNEYFTTYKSKGRNYMHVHKGKDISTKWTEELDD
jgi:hypothetical protein